MNHTSILGTRVTPDWTGNGTRNGGTKVCMPWL